MYDKQQDGDKALSTMENNCTIIRGYDKAFTYIESWLYKIYWHIKYQLYNTQQYDD